MTASSEVSLSLKDKLSSSAFGAGARHGSSRLEQSVKAEIESGQQELSLLEQENGTYRFSREKSGGYAGGSARTLDAYDSLKRTDSFVLNESITSPGSRLFLLQGTVVPAVLLTGINSDLPGQVSAQVSENVYDSKTGNALLIPQGSRLMGQYNSQVAFGQERVMLAFNRLIFPDGRSLNLGAMAGTTPDGFAGFEADVNTHFWRLFSTSLRLGGITTTVSLAEDNKYDDDGNLTASGALSNGLAQSLGRVMTQIFERHLNISPTLEVDPGYEFNLIFTKDVLFKEEYHYG